MRSLWLKRLFDVAASAAGLLLLAPLLLAIALWIRLDSPGPVFFRQERVGLRGQPVTGTLLVAAESIDTALLEACRAVQPLVGEGGVTRLPGLLVAAVVAGVGQGISFSRGLAAVVEGTATERRAEVSSTYFVVAYVAISLPVVSLGFAAQRWGLQEAGVSFAVIIAVLAAVCLAAVLWQERRRSA